MALILRDRSSLALQLPSGADQKIRKGVAGTLAQLCRYFLFFWEFYKNNTKFQRKKGGWAPLGPPLNRQLALVKQVNWMHRVFKKPFSCNLFNFQCSFRLPLSKTWSYLQKKCFLFFWHKNGTFHSVYYSSLSTSHAFTIRSIWFYIIVQSCLLRMFQRSHNRKPKIKTDPSRQVLKVYGQVARNLSYVARNF